MQCNVWSYSRGVSYFSNGCHFAFILSSHQISYKTTRESFGILWIVKMSFKTEATRPTNIFIWQSIKIITKNKSLWIYGLWGKIAPLGNVALMGTYDPEQMDSRNHYTVYAMFKYENSKIPYYLWNHVVIYRKSK